jgi:ribose transport system ATP-binding protein
MNLSMRGIVKSFGANQVLRQVDFSLEAGEICALLGENGAGKSTLMKILAGVIQPDAGRIMLDGKPVSFPSPAYSLNAGIAFIHQDLNLINDLPVYENMFIGREIKKRGFIDHQEELRQTRALFDRMEIRIDPTVLVSSLDASYKQIVEISRALMMKASVIIMDEPTTSLTDPEIERVFDMLRMLKKQQVGVIFISHKLREVMEICDRYVVLRDGVAVSGGRVRTLPLPGCPGIWWATTCARRLLPKRADRPGGAALEDLTQEPHYSHIHLTVRAGRCWRQRPAATVGRTVRTVFGDGGKSQGRLYWEGSP